MNKILVGDSLWTSKYEGGIAQSHKYSVKVGI